jgi:hypothetical protein
MLPVIKALLAKFNLRLVRAMWIGLAYALGGVCALRKRLAKLPPSQ